MISSLQQFAFVSLLAAVTGCSGHGPAANQVVVYSPHGKDLLSEFERRFELLHPDVDVRWLDMGSQDIFDRVRTERNNPQADVWWGAPSILFMKAAEEGLLASYVPPWDSAVSPQEKSSGGHWYGTYRTPEVIVFNTKRLWGDVPKDWDDLLDARWKNKIILRYPIASGTMRIIFSALIDREIKRTGDVLSGFRWLRRLDGNVRSYVADPTQLYLKLAREEDVLTVWNLPDVQLQVQVHDFPFGFVIPQSGTPMVVEGIAIVGGAKHPGPAKEFYDYVTSRESMILAAGKFFRIPVRSDIESSALPHWVGQLDLKPMDVDWRLVMEKEQEWMGYWEEHIKGKGAP